MPLDFLAAEPHFVDHLAPVWRALPAPLRGRFHVAPDVVEHAQKRGIRPSSLTILGSSRGPILTAAYGDIKRARHAGRQSIAFLEHGIGQAYPGVTGSAEEPSYAGGRDHGDVGLFLVPNAYAAARWRAVLPGARIEIVGSPKIDDLPRRAPGPGPVVAVSFHWDCRVVHETRTAFYEYRDAIATLARTYTVIGHGHPRLFLDRRAFLESFYKSKRIEVVRDFEEVLRRADVYVCDNSSTLYEFASTGRPVVVLNSHRYRRKVKHGLRFWEAANVGLNVDAPRLLPGTVARALTDPPEAQANREAALDIVYGVRSGGARMAAAVLADWVAGRV